MADSADASIRPESPVTPSALPLGTLEFVVMIAGLMALNALAIDIMLPALDDMNADFQLARANDQQLIIYAYIAGFGVPQLVWGPLTDRLGRRSVVQFALVGYALTALACMFAPGFWQLLAVRFCQGVFASACRVVAVSVVRDVFVGRGMARIMSLVMTIFMVVPILAPSIGQLVLLFGSWQHIFAVLMVMSLAMLAWVWLRLPETLPPDARQPLNFAAAGRAYLEVCRSRVTFGYMLAAGFIFGALFAFIGSAEQVMTEVFDTGESFALWFAAIAGVLSLSNFTNSRLVERFGMRRMSQAALLAFILLALTLLAVMLLVGPVFWLFMPLFALMFGCFGMIGSNFSALAMEPLGRIAGTASAAYGFATTVLSSLIGWMIGSQYDGTVIPLVSGFAGLGLVCLVIVAIVERGKFFSSR